ncbi:MAG: NUDIX domain-containing protein [Ectothiorhodospiraceae bacterium]|nr:NUDIX domain-containing protein [Ectothiorhodospiraceae bacterium]
MEPKKKPARPRDAASLVLVRGRGPDTEVLLGRRDPAARFMPGYYVFPGGGVDRTDARATPASPLDPSIEPSLAVGGRSTRARALAMAAVRETFEETGLVLGAPGDPGPVAEPTWDAMRALGLAPALSRLRYLGRAITPTRSPIRFHARFFIADAEHAHGDVRGNGELHEIDWIPAASTAGLPMAGVTRFILDRLAELADRLDHRDPVWAFTYRNSGRSLRIEEP